jgi:hypothetical protein
LTLSSAVNLDAVIGLKGLAFNPASTLREIDEESVNVMPIEQSVLVLRIDSFWT